MIFDLPQDVQLTIARMQLILHHRCSDMLAEPLTPDTLHMTLHDLLNGVDEAALAQPVRETGAQARAILADQRSASLPPVRLTATAAFSRQPLEVVTFTGAVPLFSVAGIWPDSAV